MSYNVPIPKNCVSLLVQNSHGKKLERKQPTSQKLSKFVSATSTGPLYTQTNSHNLNITTPKFSNLNKLQKEMGGGG